MEKLPLVLLFSGLIALGLSVILGWVFIPNFIHDQIEEKVRLENGTETFEKWRDVDVPIFSTFRFFNVTNPDEVWKKGQKPILKEVGPYVYQQKRYKTDIRINEENDTISYRQPVTYHFRSDLSKGTDDDFVTTLNMPLIAVGEMAEKYNRYVTLFTINLYIRKYKEEPFVRKKVRELLFEGYHVGVVDSYQNITRKEVLSNSTFGFYYGKNQTDDGVYEIRSGLRDSSTFGEIVSWKGMSQLSWWGKSGGGEFCNKINGSDGSIFPPFVGKDRIVRLFSADLCRSLYLTYREEVEYMSVPALKFTVPADMLADPLTNPDTRCFCPNPDPVEENCPKAGVMKLSVCRKGAPIVASTPHFLDGDEFYVNQSIGLSPDRERHETYLHLEPNTGLVLEGRKRIQINIETKAFKNVDVLQKLPSMIFPIFWVEESFSATDETVDRLNGKLLFSLKSVQAGKWIFVSLSCLLIIFGIGVFCLRTRRKRQFV